MRGAHSGTVNAPSVDHPSVHGALTAQGTDSRSTRARGLCKYTADIRSELIDHIQPESQTGPAVTPALPTTKTKTACPKASR